MFLKRAADYKNWFSQMFKTASLIGKAGFKAMVLEERNIKLFRTCVTFTFLSQALRLGLKVILWRCQRSFRDGKKLILRCWK